MSEQPEYRPLIRHRARRQLTRAEMFKARVRAVLAHYSAKGELLRRHTIDGGGRLWIDS
jgi:hypothetical protein